jgi:hypothetical protein
MPTPEHLHLALNHFPILGVPIAGAVIARGVFAKNEESLRVGFFLLMICAAFTPVIMSTGSSASDAYDGADFVDSPGYVWMTTHGERAETTAIVAYVAGALGLVGFISGYFFKKFLRLTGILALSAAFITGALAVWTADSGGKIRRPDFREKTSDSPTSENHTS